LKKPGDDLENWSASRDATVAENNTDAAATSDLAGVVDGWQNNPDAVLQSLGIPPYIPGMSSMVPPPGYGSPYGSGAYSPYGSGLYTSGLYGSGLYGSSLYGYSLYGPGFVPYGPLFIYGSPLYRSYSQTYGYRGLTTIPNRIGGYGPARSLGTVRPGVGIGVGRPAFGGVHVGGGRR
jgi:hypothetical protein